MVGFTLYSCVHFRHQNACGLPTQSRNNVLLVLSTLGTSYHSRFARSNRASNRNYKPSETVAPRTFQEVCQDPTEKERPHLGLCQVARFPSNPLLVGANEVGAVPSADRRIALLHQIFHAQARLPHAPYECWHDGAATSPARVHRLQALLVSLSRRRSTSIVLSGTCYDSANIQITVSPGI